MSSKLYKLLQPVVEVAKIFPNMINVEKYVFTRGLEEMKWRLILGFFFFVLFCFVFFLANIGLTK